MRGVCVTSVAFTILLVGAAGAPAQRTLSVPRLSIPAGSDLAAVVRALATTGEKTVVAADVSAAGADVSLPAAVLRTALVEAPLEEALTRISLDFDRAIVRRGRVLALQRRFSSPAEEAGLEVEELREAAVAMDTLMRPFTPRFDGVAYIEAQAAFVASIQPQQQERMLRDGLPVAELPERQRALWLQINAGAAYGDAARELRRARLCLTRWDRVSVEDTGYERRPRTFLSAWFPDPAGFEGKGVISATVPSANVRARTPAAEVTVLSESRAAVSGSLRAEWSLSPQIIELRALAQRLAVAGGPTLAVPSYAEGRQLWVASSGASRHEVLTGVGLLWGWQVAPSRGGFRIGLPKLTPARSAAELHHKLRETVPPALRQSIQARFGESATERQGELMKRALREVDNKLGAEWRRFRPAELTAPNQRRVAEFLATEAIGAAGFRPSLAEERAWVLYPEQARLFLSGPLGPDAHPMLSAIIRNNRGRRSGWGWAVGTAKLVPGSR